MDGWTERPNHGDARNPKWSILLLLTWSFCRLGGHSIHQYASRLAAIGIQKFPELSSYGISKAFTSKSFLDQKPTNIFPAMSFCYKKFSRPKSSKYLQNRKVKILSCAGKFTFFVPIDSAFDTLRVWIFWIEKSIRQLLNISQKVGTIDEDVVRAHIVPDTLLFSPK